MSFASGRSTPDRTVAAPHCSHLGLDACLFGFTEQLPKALIYLENVHQLHGIPKVLASDWDKIFTSLFWTELMKLSGTALHFCLACYLQTNGPTECLNQYLEMYLRCMAHQKLKGWAKCLALMKWWYNKTYHSSLKMTLFQALYDYAPLQFLDTVYIQTPSQTVEEFLMERQRISRGSNYYLKLSRESISFQIATTVGGISMNKN